MHSTEASFEEGAEAAVELDRCDSLARFRDRFLTPPGQIYLASNCLGLQPTAARRALNHELSIWAERGFRGHFVGEDPWLERGRSLERIMARLVGALPEEVALMNSLTVNLHLMLASFYRPTRSRYKILTEPGAFPSDQFVVQSHLEQHGFGPSDALLTLPTRSDGQLDLESALSAIDAVGDEVALILLSNPSFRTGQCLDMARVTRRGHARGCLVGFDVAHAAGNLELRLHDWDVDFAVWCTYKYLCGGPGSVGACFVHERHADSQQLVRWRGWWGQNDAMRFEMPTRAHFEPAAGAAGWQLSSPPILAMATLCAALPIFEEATLPRMRDKSLLLNSYFQFLLERKLPNCCTVLTPRDPAQRGCQLTLLVQGNAGELQRFLLKRGVVCDVKGQDVLRVAPSPLYNGFRELYAAIEALAQFPGFARAVTA